MQQEEVKAELGDAKLAVELLKGRVLNEVQLKAAIDYQESIGGRLRDVLAKLELVREQKLREFLAGLESEHDTSHAAVREEKLKPTPDILAGLRLHRKLLEKVPEDVRRRFGILLFFPPPGTRAILFSGRPEPPPEDLERLRGILGIELQPIELSSDERRPFLASAPESTEPPKTKKKTSGATPSPPQGDSGDGGEVLKGLVSLLVRKNVITKEELKVELHLLRRRRD